MRLCSALHSGGTNLPKDKSQPTTQLTTNVDGACDLQESLQELTWYALLSTLPVVSLNFGRRTGWAG
jgi:hypothetical protein